MSTEPEIKVIHINTEKGWRGGERQVFNLARQLQQHAIAQIVVAKIDSELGRRCRQYGIEVTELALRGEWDIFSAKKLASIANDFQASIIHAHTAKAHSIGLMARKKMGKGVSLLVSRRVDFPIRHNYLSRKKYFHPLVAGYIAISENVSRMLIIDGIPANKIQIAYSGIDLSVWQDKRDAVSLRSEFRLHPDILVFGNVAALVDHKDQQTMLSAIEILEKSKTPDMGAYRFFVLGEGELESDLKKQAREAGILYPDGPVQFTGYRDDVYEFYSIFDVFILTSKAEGLGTAVLDAMAAELPVVATRAGGIPEMIEHEKGGLLSEPGEPAELAGNLKRIITSAELRQKMASFNKKKGLKL